MTASNNDMPDRVPEDLPSHVADHLIHRAAPWLIRGLDVLSLLVVGATVFAIGQWKVSFPNGLVIRTGAPVNIQPHEPISSTTLPSDVEVVGFNAWLPSPSTFVDYLVRSVDVLPSALILLFVLRVLRAVVAGISRGEVFTDANASRICFMGASLVIGMPVVLICTALATQLQLTRAGLDDDVISTVDLLDVVFPMLGGLLLLILGGVFKMGVRMRNEVEGLV